MQIWALVIDTFRESMEKRLFWVLLMISGVLVAALACINFDETGLSLAFGVWKIESPMFTRGSEAAHGLILGIIAQGLIDNYIAWVGVLLCLVATAPFFPAMLERGAVDVMLGKPISRPALFFGKYLGALTFVAVEATALVLPVVLVVGFNMGIWLWKLLWCIPLVIGSFSYLYCFGCLAAVGSRSPMMCIISSLVLWAVVSMAQNAYVVMHVQFNMQSGWAPNLVRAARAVLPKTYDVGPIAANLIDAPTVASSFRVGAGPGSRPPGRSATSARGNDELTEQDLNAMEDAERMSRNVNVAYSVGSSLGFEVVVLVLACWRFSRRDY